jgi:hypothetical protein
VLSDDEPDPRTCGSLSSCISVLKIPGTPSVPQSHHRRGLSWCSIGRGGEAPRAYEIEGSAAGEGDCHSPVWSKFSEPAARKRSSGRTGADVLANGGVQTCEISSAPEASQIEVSPKSTVFGAVSAGSYTHKPSICHRQPVAWVEREFQGFWLGLKRSNRRLRMSLNLKSR